jgi:hypothetical protein
MAERQKNQAQLLLQGLSNRFSNQYCRFIDNFSGDMQMSHLVKILLSDSRLGRFSLHFDKSLTSGIQRFVPFLNGNKQVAPKSQPDAPAN